MLTATVDVIEEIAAASPEFTPPQSAIVEQQQPHVAVASGVAQGMLTKQVRPNYPADALSARISGTVVMQAQTGVDGRVHDLRVVSGPSASLVGAAMLAVSQWVYKPYMLHGEPVPIETTVNVVFNLR